MAEVDQQQLEERFDLELPDEEGWPEWIVFKVGLSTAKVQLTEVGQVRAYNADLAVVSLVEHHPGADGCRFCALPVEEVRGRKVRLTYVAHLED